MPGIPSEDACFFGGTPRNYALTIFIYATIFFYTIFLMPAQLLASAAFFVLLWAKIGSME